MSHISGTFMKKTGIFFLTDETKQYVILTMKIIFLTGMYQAGSRTILIEDTPALIHILN
ncbi:hypothetical protein FACS1894172_01210 [Spirochaetia bacterium]|nr:hypothetical protein FACS1894164_06890 [Spirochaetia bacterium]GHU29645.1 hypothetical protein FACS1894172_01210 [Spirochaetia bacterium]